MRNLSGRWRRKDSGKEAVVGVVVEDGERVVGEERVEGGEGETSKLFEFGLTFEKLSEVGI